jgi:predicted CopG family antitoxin
MRTIEVDFDVYKALLIRRPHEGVTENDVLRELLGLAKKGEPHAAHEAMGEGDWVVKAVRFPAGTEFRARYRGELHLGRVLGGALVLNGKRYDTPSAAAMAITNGTPVNGWTFWECRQPGEAGWRKIKALRSN